MATITLDLLDAKGGVMRLPLAKSWGDGGSDGGDTNTDGENPNTGDTGNGTDTNPTDPVNPYQDYVDEGFIDEDKKVLKSFSEIAVFYSNKAFTPEEWKRWLDGEQMQISEREPIFVTRQLDNALDKLKTLYREPTEEVYRIMNDNRIREASYRPYVAEQVYKNKGYGYISLGGNKTDDEKEIDRNIPVVTGNYGEVFRFDNYKTFLNGVSHGEELLSADMTYTLGEWTDLKTQTSVTEHGLDFSTVISRFIRGQVHYINSRYGINTSDLDTLAEKNLRKFDFKWASVPTHSGISRLPFTISIKAHMTHINYKDESSNWGEFLVSLRRTAGLGRKEYMNAIHDKYKGFGNLYVNVQAVKFNEGDIYYDVYPYDLED